jgi:hypothetical protein
VHEKEVVFDGKEHALLSSDEFEMMSNLS